MTAPPLPDPSSVAGFVASLRRLKAWSGLSYRALERQGGGHLPASTAATMLGRERLPREELLTTFVRACGTDPTPWTEARTALAISTTVVTPRDPRPSLVATAGVSPSAAGAAGQVRRRAVQLMTRRWRVVAAVALVVGVAVAGVTARGQVVEETVVVSR